jgi:hypothetical protein
MNTLDKLVTSSIVKEIRRFPKWKQVVVFVILLVSYFTSKFSKKLYGWAISTFFDRFFYSKDVKTKEN